MKSGSPATPGSPCSTDSRSQPTSASLSCWSCSVGLLADIEAGKVDIVVVNKIDRLTRSLTDFSRMIEVFERHGC